MAERNIVRSAKRTAGADRMGNDVGEVAAGIRHVSSPEAAGLPEVLIVEDDYLTQAVIAGFLRGMCSTEHAHDAKTAIEMAREKQYSAVLMDIHLGPGQNGVDVTREIRGIPGYERSPIVAVTGSTLPGEQERLLASGMTHYVAKPFDREELVRVLSDALGHAR